MLVGLCLLCILLNIEYTIVKYKIVHYTKIENNHLYILDNIDNDRKEYILKVTDTPLILKNDHYIKKSISDLTCILVFASILMIFSGSLIILLNIIFSDFIPNDIIYNILYSKLKYDYENDVYNYHIYNRLVGITNEEIGYSYLSWKFDIYTLKDVLRCPIYKTKSQKREELLGKLLK
ncbi:MAG: hypothetical protein M0R46_06420 [Candidatus Muirbacterium halophilum]|nr:hypothetical protein [Candidatus Muirbacterium halophilum]